MDNPIGQFLQFSYQHQLSQEVGTGDGLALGVGDGVWL